MLDRFLNFRRRGATPAAKYFEGYYHSRRTDLRWNRLLDRPRKQLTVIALVASLAVGGVVASVAISIYGNNSNVAGQVSLGVGGATATACDLDNVIHTDTIGTYVDSMTDFVLQQVNVTQVDPNCTGKLLNLVVKLNGANDINLTCTLPATTSLASSSWATTAFAFATSAVTATTSYECSRVMATNILLASIAATAVQIK